MSIEFEVCGATLHVGGERLTSGCMAKEEVDYAVKMFKKELDAMAKKMKALIHKKRKEPLFPDSDP